MFGLPALAAGMGLSTVVPLLVLYYLLQRRERPGAQYMFAALAAGIGWTVLYAIQLSISDPSSHRLVGAAVWAISGAVPVLFLMFTLAYTGRERWLDQRLLAGMLVIPLVTAVFVVTNPASLMWEQYRVGSTFGLAPAVTVPGLWFYFATGYANLIIGIAVLLLAETLASYGDLYRDQIAALLAGVLIVMPTNLLWLLGAGPIPNVNFTPVAINVSSAFIAYALYNYDIFQFAPAIRRIGEQTAIDDFGDAVFIVDEELRIVELNALARHLCGTDDPLARPITDVLPVDRLAPDGEQTFEHVVDGEHRQFALTASPIESGRRETGIGYTVLLHDVTAERRRQQRLDVLNRVLRHNLRNDMMTVQAKADRIAATVESEEAAAMANDIETTALDLVELGDRARDVQQLLGSEETERVDIEPMLAAIVDQFRREYPDCEIRYRCPDLTIRTNPNLVELALRIAIENGIEHNDSAVPRVDATVREAGDSIECRITDNGPGIPDHEIAVIQRGRENKLDHGSGLDLWVLDWSVRYLGGSLSFETGDDGSTVAIELPTVESEDVDVSPAPGSTAATVD